MKNMILKWDIQWLRHTIVEIYIIQIPTFLCKSGLRVFRCLYESRHMISKVKRNDWIKCEIGMQWLKIKCENFSLIYWNERNGVWTSIRSKLKYLDFCANYDS